MKYQISLFYKGERQLAKLYCDAKSHKEALKIISSTYTWANWTNAFVISKSGIGKRYNVKLKRLKDDVRYFPVKHNDRFSILAMIDSYAEFHEYENETQRNEVLSLCTTSAPAVYAEADKAQSDITVSSEEMLDSRSGLTSKKTSNGSVMSAIWMDEQIPWNTEEIFTEGSATNSAWKGLSVGSDRSRSRPRPIFATLKKQLGRGYHTVMVVPSGDARYWINTSTKKTYDKKDLEFRHAYLKIKDGISVHSRMQKCVGKIAKMHKCSDHWNDGRFCWDMKFLEIPKLIKKGKLIGGHGQNCGVHMSDLHGVGEVQKFQYSSTGNWQQLEYDGFFLEPHWIEFRRYEDER